MGLEHGSSKALESFEQAASVGSKTDHHVWVHYGADWSQPTGPAEHLRAQNVSMAGPEHMDHSPLGNDVGDHGGSFLDLCPLGRLNALDELLYALDVLPARHLAYPLPAICSGLKR